MKKVIGIFLVCFCVFSVCFASGNLKVRPTVNFKPLFEDSMVKSPFNFGLMFKSNVKEDTQFTFNWNLGMNFDFSSGFVFGVEQLDLSARLENGLSGKGDFFAFGVEFCITDFVEFKGLINGMAEGYHMGNAASVFIRERFGYVLHNRIFSKYIFAGENSSDGAIGVARLNYSVSEDGNMNTMENSFRWFVPFHFASGSKLVSFALPVTVSWGFDYDFATGVKPDEFDFDFGTDIGFLSIYSAAKRLNYTLSLGYSQSVRNINVSTTADEFFDSFTQGLAHLTSTLCLNSKLADTAVYFINNLNMDMDLNLTYTFNIKVVSNLTGHGAVDYVNSL